MAGTLTLTKSFRFESAHRLAKGYVGKCANIHGHSWNGELTVVVDGTDAFDMAIDYKHLKDVVKGWEDWLDHRLWLCSTDPLAAALRERPEWDGVVLFTNNPTSETLAQVLADQGLASLRARFGMKVVEVSVTVRETCTTSCTYTARP